MRPRYRRTTPIDSESLMQTIIEKLRKSENITGSTLENHAYLRVPVDNQHYWSPEFNITIENNEDGGSLVRGVVGPRPRVWTMFMFLYSAVIVLLFLGLSMGVSQYMLGMDAPILWSIPACVILWILIVLASKFGQFKAKDQTLRLWSFVEEIIDEEEIKLA